VKVNIIAYKRLLTLEAILKLRFHEKNAWLNKGCIRRFNRISIIEKGEEKSMHG